MTLESLLEIKPDRAGGPVKTRPGQLLPDGTNGASQDGSPLSGSPASTSSAGEFVEGRSPFDSCACADLRSVACRAT